MINLLWLIPFVSFGILEWWALQSPDDDFQPLTYWLRKGSVLVAVFLSWFVPHVFTRWKEQGVKLAPKKKVAAAGIGSSVVLILIAVLEGFGVEVDPLLASALTGGAGFGSGYMKKD